MDYGGNMKPDNYTTPPKGDTPKGMLIMKLKKLGTAIEMKKGSDMFKKVNTPLLGKFSSRLLQLMQESLLYLYPDLQHVCLL